MIGLVHRPWKISTFRQINFNIDILWKIMKHLLSSGCHTNQTKPYEYDRIFPNYTSLINFYIHILPTAPCQGLRASIRSSNNALRTATRACLKSWLTGGWSHGCFTTTSIGTRLQLDMFLPLHLSIVACCCNHGFQISKGQRCLFCKDLEHMNPVE